MVDNIITLDLGTESLVTKVVTDGSGSSRVKTYHVSYRRSTSDAWSFVRETGDSRFVIVVLFLMSRTDAREYVSNVAIALYGKLL